MNLTSGDLGHLFHGTKLDQPVLSMESYKVEGENAFTPFRIRGYASYVREVAQQRRLTHEVAHVIDFWLRGRHDRLVHENFGFDGNNIGRVGAKLEAFVTAVEESLIVDCYGEVFSCDIYSDDKLISAFAYRGYTMKPQDWNNWVDDALDDVKALGLPHLYRAWHDACSFISRHRGFEPGVAYDPYEDRIEVYNPIDMRGNYYFEKNACAK